MSEGSQSEGGTPPSGDRQELPNWSRSRTKRKANVKAEAEQDAFTRGVMDAGRAAKNQARLWVGLIVLGVSAIGIGVLWKNSRAEARVEATRALSEAAGWGSRAQLATEERMAEDASPPDPLYLEASERDEAYEAALARAAAVDEDEVASLAKLMDAARKLKAGEPGDARTAYEAWVASHAADHPMMFLAREGRGLALEAEGDLEGALANFEAMTAEGGSDRFYADVALWHQGRLLERLNRTADAVAVYKRYLELYPEGQRASIALADVKERLRELDAPKPEAPSSEAAPEAPDAVPVAPDAPGEGEPPAPTGDAEEKTAENEAP